MKLVLTLCALSVASADRLRQRELDGHLVALDRDIVMCTPSDTCSECQGDCHTDEDCADDLICYHVKDRPVPPTTIPGCAGKARSKTDWCISPFSLMPQTVCTPENVTVVCGHSACSELVPGTCFELSEVSQMLKPDMQECYGEKYPVLKDAAYLWNERSMRGIPAIATAEGTGTIEGKHMQIDIALMFDHWDIIDQKVNEILEINPDDPHALFVKAMYGFEGVLPTNTPEMAVEAIAKLYEVAPATARMVDRALADVKMTWFNEFLHPLTTSEDDKDVCAIGMNFTYTDQLFPTFSCELIPEQYDPRELAIVVFGANHPVLLDARIDTAQKLAERYPQAKIVATGGALGALDRAEGDLILEGMPEHADRITVDRGARDTIGNSLALAEFLRENDGVANLLLVSSSFHLPRATMAVRGVLQRLDMHPRTYMVAAGNNLQAELGTWNEENQAWLETAYGGGGRFRVIEIPMTNRDFARGAGLFTMCDFMDLEE